jgi:hypothetical protein
VAEYLVEKGYLSWRKLRLLRHTEWNDFEGPGEPVTGVAGSLMGTVTNIFTGIGGVPYRMAKATKRREKKKQKKQAKQAKSRSGADGNGKKGDQTPQVETITTNALHHTATRDTTPSTAENPAEELALQVGRGAKKSATALACAPVDLSIALAQGFHNAPRLYGDDTVRRPPRVTGFRSGLKAARYEFVYGIYDGWTGIVRLPIRGARDGGVLGFVKGVGMGLTGFVLKDLAALIGPVGYTLKGLVKQAERGRQPIKFVRRARIVQGQRQFRALNGKERERVVQEVTGGWDVMRALWEAIELQEREKGRMRSRMGCAVRSRRGKGPAFESVDIAERVLAAVKRGQTVESVMGKEAGKKSLESTYERHKEKEKQQRKSQDNKRRESTGGGQEKSGSGFFDKRPSTSEAVGESHGNEPGSALAEGDTKGVTDAPAANGEIITPVISPAEDPTNPFALSDEDIARNKTEAKMDEAILPGKT